MDKKMFCFQCEQTVGCTGCTGNAGVCGKKADTAKLQDELTGALIGLARAVDGAETISKRTGKLRKTKHLRNIKNINKKLNQKTFLKTNDWFLTAADVSHRAVKQTNTTCSSCGMPTKIFVP